MITLKIKNYKGEHADKCIYSIKKKELSLLGSMFNFTNRFVEIPVVLAIHSEPNDAFVI